LKWLNHSLTVYGTISLTMATYNVRKIMSNRLTETSIVLDSKRQPGFTYKFTRTKNNAYRCCRCFELGKQRTILVENGFVTGKKNPEDGHHAACVPLEDGILQVCTV
jgi:hypothetical protein